MKKGAALIILFVFSAIQVYSQVFVKPMIGGNISTNTGIDKYFENYNLGYNICVEIDATLNEQTKINLDIQFIEKGFKVKLDSKNYSSSAFYYAEISLLFQENFLSTKKITPFIKLGPYLGFWEDGKQTNVINNIEKKSEIQFGETYSRLDIGISGGLGFDLNNFSFELRGDWGLSDLGLNSEKKSFNSTYQLLIGYQISLN